MLGHGGSDMKALLAAAAATASLAASTAAHAVNINFHFYGERFAQGDVSGTIYDLAANGLSTPDRIIFVDQLPAYWQMYGIWGGGADLRGSEISGQFDLVNGQLVSGAVAAENGSNGEAFTWDFSNQNIYVSVNGQTTLAYYEDRITEGGSQPDFVSYPTPAPEPSTWTLLITGIGTIGGAFRVAVARRRRTARYGLTAT